MGKLLKYKEFFILSFLLVFAAFLRLYKISDYMTFLGDEGRDVLVVYNILHGKFTLLGPTASVGGFFLGPIYYYFMVPFLWLFKFDPVGPAVMVALFGIATVILIYKIGSDFFDKKTGFIAAFFYTISPVVIAYSRSSWNPNLMPFFSLLTLFILYKATRERNIKLFIFCGFLLGIVMQLHYLALFLGAIIFFYILITEFHFIRILKNSLYLFLGFVIGWLPFLAFEFKHGFPNIQSILKFIFRSGDTGANVNFLDTVFNVFFRLFGRLVTKFPPPEQVSSLQGDSTIALWYFSTLALAIASCLIFLFRYFKTRKENEKIQRNSYEFEKYSLIISWFFIGILSFGFYKKPIYDYYLGFMFPLPFLLVGNFISSLPLVANSIFTAKKSEVVQVVAGGVSVVVFIILVWVNLQGVPFRFSANRQRDQVKLISDFVLSKTNEKPFNFALITEGNSDHAYRYFFKLANSDPVVILNPKVDPQRKSVTDQLLIVCEDPSCRPLGKSLWEVAGFGRAEIKEKWDISVVQVYKLVHYKGE